MIGTKLYHYLTLRGVGTYEVIGVDGDFIIAKCLVCSNKNHPCIVKLNRVDGYKTRWKYVSMLQNCGSDTYENSTGEEVNNEYMWHNDSHYFEKKSDCKRWKGQEIISNRKGEIEKMKNEIKTLKEKIKTGEDKIKELELWMNNEDAS
jgi:hypothetical protein